LSVGGIRRSVFMKQDQEYGALQNYADFQFLMMSTTDQISIDTAKINAKLRSGKTLTQADSVQHPFGADSLTLPGWRRDVSDTAPVQAFLTVPFSIGGVKIVTGSESRSMPT